MTPLEAGARAYDNEWDKPEVEGEMAQGRHERCIRAALIAAVGALSDEQVERVIYSDETMGAEPNFPFQARANLVKQLTEER